MEIQNRSVVSSIITKLANCGSSYSTKICIYRVPPKLRGVNEAAYTPQVIGIGPFHHGKEHLADMERHKYIYLNKFLERVGASGRRLEDFVSHIQQSEGSIRECYADALEDLSSDEFCEIILVDSIFILELFKSTEEWPRNFDFIVHGAWPKYQIKEDLMLLENQIPWWLLEQLYQLAFGTVHNDPFHSLATNYFSDIVPRIERLPSHDGTKHFTDLVRRSLLFGSSTEKPPAAASKEENENSSRELLYGATKLREAGVRFKMIRNPCILNIKFENGKLEIPRFEFDDHTECIYRNVMALEQCHYPDKPLVCHYVAVLDDLIDSAKDVELLVENKIFGNFLGEHQTAANVINKLCEHQTAANVINKLCEHQTAANVINKLCLHICTPYSDPYANLIEDLNEYYQVPYNYWKANLKHAYFSTSGRIAYTVPGFIGLVLTLTQTLFTILQYALVLIRVFVYCKNNFFHLSMLLCGLPDLSVQTQTLLH